MANGQGLQALDLWNELQGLGRTKHHQERLAVQRSDQLAFW
jgi:hypothetical protein